MRYKATIAICTAMLSAFAVSAQEAGNEDFAVKANAEIGIGKALSIQSALPGMKTSSSGSNFGADFGWTFWRKEQHSIEANIGLGYAYTTVKANIPGIDYSYSAPADADMDNDTYIRYYNMEGTFQKSQVQRITLPLYVNYNYQFSKVFSLHALLGFRFGFNFSPKLKDSEASVFSYGVYPQYGDLMIDAPYMNDFGTANVGANTSKPLGNKVTAAFLAGLGGEFRVYGPFSIDLSFRYEAGFNDLFKKAASIGTDFDASTAPVTYTVAEGQKVKPLSYYFTKSKISHFSAAISFIYHFNIPNK